MCTHTLCPLVTETSAKIVAGSYQYTTDLQELETARGLTTPASLEFFRSPVLKMLRSPIQPLFQTNTLVHT